MDRLGRTPTVTRASFNASATVKSLRSLAIVLSALMIGPGEAQIQRTPFLVAGVGLAPCEAWTEARQGRTADAYEQWVMGFVSGVSAVSEGMAPLFRVDAGTVEGWVDSYCLDHARDRIATAAAAFVTAHPR
jgi:hypothetical protein